MSRAIVLVPTSILMAIGVPPLLLPPGLRPATATPYGHSEQLRPDVHNGVPCPKVKAFQLGSRGRPWFADCWWKEAQKRRSEEASGPPDCQAWPGGAAQGATSSLALFDGPRCATVCHFPHPGAQPYVPCCGFGGKSQHHACSLTPLALQAATHVQVPHPANSAARCREVRNLVWTTTCRSYVRSATTAGASVYSYLTLCGFLAASSGHGPSPRDSVPPVSS